MLRLGINNPAVTSLAATPVFLPWTWRPKVQKVRDSSREQGRLPSLWVRGEGSGAQEEHSCTWCHIYHAMSSSSYNLGKWSGHHSLRNVPAWTWAETPGNPEARVPHFNNWEVNALIGGFITEIKYPFRLN